MAQNENFLKKISQWEKMKRKDWQWEHEPNHRKTILNAMKINNQLSHHMKSDVNSLQSLEEGLEVMNTYLNEEKKGTNSSNNLNNNINESISQQLEIINEKEMIQDCLQLKYETQEKIKKNIKKRRESFNVIEPPILLKNLTPDGPSQGIKPAVLNEDHIDQPQQTSRNETGLTFLTDVDIIEKNPETIITSTTQNKVIKPSVSEKPPASASSSASSSHHPTQSRVRNIHSVESLLQLLPTKLKNKDVEEGNDERNRRKSIESAVVTPFSRPKSSSTSTAALDGTTLIERQTEWMEKIEAKRRSAKIAQEKELIKEIQPSPNISLTQQSWERAKKSHLKEVVKESANEILKRQLEEMKEEMRNLRIEEKKLKLKCSQSTAKLLENERKAREESTGTDSGGNGSGGEGRGGGGGGRRTKSRGKKKRKKERKQSDEERSDGSLVDQQNSDQETKLKQHVIHIENTPVVRKRETRPSSAGHYRPPSSSSCANSTASRSNLHLTSSSSSTTVFPELQSTSSTTSLFDVLDLVLSPSPRYPTQELLSSGGSKTNRREAFQVNSIQPSSDRQIPPNNHQNNENEDNISSSSTVMQSLRSHYDSPTSLNFQSHQQFHSHNPHIGSHVTDNDSYDDSTMISNLTDRTPWRPTEHYSNLHNSLSPPPSLSHSNRFFDSSSTSDKGRYRINDARDFDIKSMFRKIDILNPSVTLLMGKRRNSNLEEIITILFDRSTFTEEEARQWWQQNHERLLVN